jgi:hypothetical protein
LWDHREVVAVLETGDITEALAYRSILGKLAWRRPEWKGAQPHLALLVDEDLDIRWLGRAQGGPIITGRERLGAHRHDTAVLPFDPKPRYPNRQSSGHPGLAIPDVPLEIFERTAAARRLLDTLPTT